MIRKGGVLALSLLSLLSPPFPSPSFCDGLSPKLKAALAASAQELITVEDLLELKKHGVSDEVILRMLQRASRERARCSGISRVLRRRDGKEVIVYGSPSEPPRPEGGYYYVGPGGQVFLLRDAPEGEEREAWDLLRQLHLEIDLQEERR